jgi:hypothetical protein
MSIVLAPTVSAERPEISDIRGMLSRRPAFIAFVSACCCLGAPAAAAATEPVARSAKPGTEPDCPSERGFHADLELDPTAYALGGFSLHVGLGFRKLRLDLGVFGLRVPEFVHQQPDFSVRAAGYGLKLQYFPFAEQRGAFVGVDGAVTHSDVHLQGSQLSARDDQLVVGVNGGIRIDIVGGLFVTPWISVGYAFAGDDVTLGGETFSSSPVIIFPALHFGYRLR